MRAHKCLRLFIQIFRVYGNTIVERVIFQKRIPDLRIKNAVNIFFGFYTVAGVKIRLFSMQSVTAISFGRYVLRPEITFLQGICLSV